MNFHLAYPIFNSAKENRDLFTLYLIYKHFDSSLKFRNDISYRISLFDGSVIGILDYGVL